MPKIDDIHADLQVLKRQMEWQNDALARLVSSNDIVREKVLVHEHKLADIEQDIKPKVEEHEKKINRFTGIMAGLAILAGGLWKAVELGGSIFFGRGQ